MSYNAVLTDRKDEQVLPITTAENVFYNGSTTVKQAIDDIIAGGGGGGGGREYLGDITPRVTEANPNITSSSYSTSYGTFYDWYAFNGVSPANYRDPQNNCWQGDGANQWIQYQFTEPRYFTELELKCFSNYSGDWVGNIKVEGSNDGISFENLLTNGSTTQQITAELAPTSEGGSGTESDITISLNDANLWTYIRVTFVENMQVSSAPSCYIDEIYVYGGKEIGGVVVDENFSTTSQNPLMNKSITNAFVLEGTTLRITMQTS